MTKDGFELYLSQGLHREVDSIADPAQSHNGNLEDLVSRLRRQRRYRHRVIQAVAVVVLVAALSGGYAFGAAFSQSREVLSAKNLAVYHPPPNSLSGPKSQGGNYGGPMIPTGPSTDVQSFKLTHVFTRTTSDGVVIRAYSSSNSMFGGSTVTPCLACNSAGSSTGSGSVSRIGGTTQALCCCENQGIACRTTGVACPLAGGSKTASPPVSSPPVSSQPINPSSTTFPSCPVWRYTNAGTVDAEFSSTAAVGTGYLNLNSPNLSSPPSSGTSQTPPTPTSSSATTSVTTPTTTSTTVPASTQAMTSSNEQMGILAESTGVFGLAEGSPTWWVIVQVSPEVSRVQVRFSDGGVDSMTTVKGIAVLAHTVAPNSASDAVVSGTITTWGQVGVYLGSGTLSETASPTPLQTVP